jgi:hypothetical protein
MPAANLLLIHKLEKSIDILCFLIQLFSFFYYVIGYTVGASLI